MKVAVITGASRGIGAVIAETFAENGYTVVINYHHSKDKAEMLARKTGGLAVQADVSKEQDVCRLFDSVKEAYGKIDVLVNNAGICASGLVQDVTEETYDRLFDVNMKSVFLTTRAAAKDMIRRQEGVIINISSMWGLVGASCESVYSATKAAVIGFTRATAKELAPSGIRVNAICPGVIDTDMNKGYSPADLQALCDQTPLGRIGTPQDVANAALFLASEKSSFITGQTLSVDGGFIL